MIARVVGTRRVPFSLPVFNPATTFLLFIWDDISEEKIHDDEERLEDEIWGTVFATFLLQILSPLAFFSTLKYVSWEQFLQTPKLENLFPFSSISFLPCFH